MNVPTREQQQKHSQEKLPPIEVARSATAPFGASNWIYALNMQYKIAVVVGRAPQGSEVLEVGTRVISILVSILVSRGVIYNVYTSLRTFKALQPARELEGLSQ